MLITRRYMLSAGWMGGTIGWLWVKSGYEVMFSSSRNTEQLVSMASKLGSQASIGTPSQSSEFGTIILFAVPYNALPQLGRDLKELLNSKIVLDACNPSAPDNDALARESREMVFL